MLAMTLQLARPLLLAAVAFAAAPWISARRAAKSGPSRSTASIVARSALLALLALALAQPRVFRAGSRVAVFTDVSASEADLPVGAVEGFDPGWRNDAYVFAGDVGRIGEAVDRDRTLAEPVLSMIGANPDRWDAAVIVTDGRIEDIGRLIGPPSKGLPVFVVGRAPAGADVRVVDLTARGRGVEGVRIVATFAATADAEPTVRITRAGLEAPLVQRRLKLTGGAPAAIELTDSPPTDRPAAYRAEVIEADLLDRNNALEALWAPPTPVVLWAAAADGAAPPEGLGGVVRVIAPEKLAAPSATSALSGYAAVVVVDASGEAISPAGREALARYVRRGGGLVLVGAGPHARPADRTDPLNRVAPLVVAGANRKRLDVTILLDASASMDEPAAAGSGERKFDLVRQATLAMARRQLAPGDRLRVITFTSKATERFDAIISAESLDRLATGLAAARPLGGTRVTEALKMAGDNESAGADRLLLILSDLQTERFNPARWARRTADAGFAVAVVAVGEPDDAAPLKRLADLAGGRFVLRADLTGLADVFARSLRLARGDAMIRRQAQVKVLAPLFDTSVTTLPAVDAFLAAVANPGAEVLAATGDGRPLVARRRVGSGRSVGLAVPLQGSPNRRWRESPEVGELLVAAIRWVAAPAGDARFDVELDRTGPTARVIVTAFDGDQPINGRSLTAGISDGSDEPRSVEMLAQAPGRYEAVLDGSVDGAVVVTVEDVATGRVVGARSFSGRYPPELSGVGVSEDGLARLAAAAGGRVVAAEALGEHLAAVRSRRALELWPWLLGAALALMLIDWLAFGSGRCGR